MKDSQTKERGSQSIKPTDDAEIFLPIKMYVSNNLKVIFNNEKSIIQSVE
jgi:hypothetical protein